MQSRSTIDSSELDIIKRKRKQSWIITSKSNIYQRKGSKNLTKFLKDNYTNAEIIAYKNITKINPEIMTSELEIFCDDWSTKLMEFPDDNKEIKEHESWINTFIRVMECQDD